MTIDNLFEKLNRELAVLQGRPLNSAETLLLRGIWQSQTYNQIAEEVGYSSGYLTNVVAPELLHRLSDLIGQRLTKKNCRFLLQEYVASDRTPKGQLQSQMSVGSQVTLDEKACIPIFPSGPIAVDSPFYIERPPIETQVLNEICKPGAMVRIKAPKEMGKTSLILRTLDYFQQQGYYTIYLNLEQFDQSIFTDLNRFLRGLCVSVTRQLQFEPKLDDYWDEDVGSKVSCTLYFRQYLLEKINAPLVLALDELNHIFEHSHVARDFLPLLRSWYEESKRVTIWQNLRLVVAHSTEVYVPLKINQSPFNIGLATQLKGFTLEQVRQLAQRYGLNWRDGESASQLMELVGGHPALIHIALYHLRIGGKTLNQLLSVASTPNGIYYHHLQRHWNVLQQQTDLFQAFHTALKPTKSIDLSSNLVYQLISMGLISYLDDRVIVSCKLYSEYFKDKII